MRTARFLISLPSVRWLPTAVTSYYEESAARFYTEKSTRTMRVLTSGSPGTSRRSGWRRPVRGRRSRPPHRGHGRPTRRYTRLACRRPSSGAAHLARGRLEHGAELLVARLAERPPRRELDCPERLRAPLVADARDQALVEERVSDRTAPLAGAERSRPCWRNRADRRGCRGRAVGPSARAARARARSTGRLPASSRARTSHGRPRRVAPRGTTDQRPVIRR